MCARDSGKEARGARSGGKGKSRNRRSWCRRHTERPCRRTQGAIDMQAFIAIKYKSYRRERIRTGIQTDNRLMRMIYVALSSAFSPCPRDILRRHFRMVFSVCGNGLGENDIPFCFFAFHVNIIRARVPSHYLAAPLKSHVLQAECQKCHRDCM